MEELKKIYYTAPSDRVFKEVKFACQIIWDDITRGSHGDYREEKVGRVSRMQNVADNFMVLVSMFDLTNQYRLSMILSDEAKNEIAVRMEAGGIPPEYNHFLDRKSGEKLAFTMDEAIERLGLKQ